MKVGVLLNAPRSSHQEVFLGCPVLLGAMLPWGFMWSNEGRGGEVRGDDARHLQLRGDGGIRTGGPWTRGNLGPSLACIRELQLSSPCLGLMASTAGVQEQEEEEEESCR